MRWLNAIILIALACKSECVPKNVSFDLVINRFLKQSPHQILIFRDEKSDFTESTQTDLIFEKIIQQVPTVTTSVNKTLESKQSQKITDNHNVSNSDLYVILENLQNLTTKKIKNKLIAISESNSLSPRAKCLVIIIGDSSTSEIIKLTKLLIDAWLLKFLDLTILLNDSVIFYYNPFFEIYHKKDIFFDELFPDKLNNMNGYKIKSFVYNFPPIIEFSNTSNGISVDGIFYGFSKLASEALKFQFDYFLIPKIFKFPVNSFDVSNIPQLLGVQMTKYHRRGKILYGRVVEGFNMHLIVPIFLRNPNTAEIYLTVIVHSCLTASIITIILIMIKYFKFTSNLWSPLYVFALILGVTVHKKALKLCERLIFVGLAILSIQYSSSIFAIFSDDSVVKNEEIVFNALEEIKYPSFPLYASKSFFRGEKNYYDDIISYLKAYYIPMEHEEQCYKKLVAQKDRFCFYSDLYARYMMQKHRNPDNSLAMKIAEPMILGDFGVFIYAKGSPFMKKFDKKFQQIFEASLQYLTPLAKNYLEAKKATKESDIIFKSTNDIGSQLIIFTIGCILGILAFIFEFIWRMIELKKKFLN